MVKSLTKLAATSLLLLQLPSQASAADESFPNLFLIGNAMQLCASDAVKACKQGTVFEKTDRSERRFHLTEDNLKRLAAVSWSPIEVNKIQGDAMLAAVAKELPEQTNERNLIRAIKKAKAIAADPVFQIAEEIPGRDWWNQLSEHERALVLDYLEVKTEVGSKRAATIANVNASKDKVALDVYYQFVNSAQVVAGKKRKPRILVITGGERDVYQSVDYYLSLLNQMGADAKWLAIDPGYQWVQSKRDAKLCDDYDALQNQFSASARRYVVYPELHQQIKESCSKSQNVMKALQSADGVLISADNNTLLYRTFFRPDGSVSVELDKIQQMFRKHQLVVGLVGTAVNAVGTGDPIVGGDRVDVLLEESSQQVADFKPCQFNEACSWQQTHRALTTFKGAGLGLFDFGLWDTNASNDGRLVRMMAAAQQRPASIVFGLDSHSAAIIDVDFNSEAPGFNMKVAGTEGLWMVDYRGEEGQAADQILPVKLSYFTHEDQVSLHKRVLNSQFAPWKFARKQAGDPFIVSNNVFAADNFAKLLNMLCLTQGDHASGEGQGFKAALVADASSVTRQGSIKLNDNNQVFCSFTGISTEIVPIQ